MAANKGLIVILTTTGVLILAIVLGVVFLYPKDASRTTVAATGTPSVFSLNVEPVVVTPAQETPSTPVPTLTPVETALDEVNAPNGLLPQVTPVAAPASPIPVTSAPEWTRRPAENTPAPSTPVPVPVRTPAARTTAPAPVRTVAPAVPPGPMFWVQVGAYHSTTQAETAAQRLETQGVRGSITTVKSGTNMMYRVRIGPWAVRTDAVQFLNRVRNLEGYEGSFVVQSG